MSAKHGRRIALIGLGYVGLPVAVAFARAGEAVIGFDIDPSRISELRKGVDRTRENSKAELSSAKLLLTNDPAALRDADFFIVTVPTPIDAARRPDLAAVLAASETVGRALSPGAIVVYESTVYPGATEEICIPALERASGLVCGRDFSVGYSPERINPGDPEHRFEKIDKVVSGLDAKTLDVVASVYGSVVTAGIHRAQSIKIAEAAKVIENAQRDLNIAFMNELSTICRLLHIDTHDVLAAAATKWNFLKFTPGLVGGHCIGVDPYYLTHRAEMAGYYPEVILAGRRINDGFSTLIVRECLRMLLKSDKPRRRVGILGLTFKEDIPDVRNSRVGEIVRELEAYSIEVRVCDPVADAEMAKLQHNVTLFDLAALAPCDAVILAVPHRAFIADGWKSVIAALGAERGIVLDVKARLDRQGRPPQIELWRP
jgi:UDP-N-acetyl-D-glucosamine/UDP-N-acetyl-D-galactosamine dehydrogenase